MTVTYTHEVANARLGGFSSLLLRWRGSVYKLFYKECAIYIVLYTILSVCYRHILISDFREYFEKLCLQFQSYTDLVPISFVLGFYVSMVVRRWWQMYLYIPWPDRLMVITAANVHGSDNRGRLIRRTLMRYLNLAQVLTYRSISTAVFKRFPTMQHVIDAGFMTFGEYKQYENLKTENVKYFVPCIWFANLLSKVRQEGRIYDDMTYQTILKELNDFRGSCGTLSSYDWISIPLVYTQVVTVAVYAFFMSTLLSRQYLDVTKGYAGHEVDLYVPIFTICQFFFYVGWLKVAEQLINPFGEDDDDFEVNFIIDRNFEISMLTVDNLYLSHPKLERDIYWNNPNPLIPYTTAAANHKLDAFLGSTIDMSLHREEVHFLDQAQAAPASSNDLDVNHNNIGVEKREFIRESPPSYASTKQAPSRVSNPVNFWKRFAAGRDKDNEMKKLLLEKVSSAATYNDNIVVEEEKNEEKYAMTPETDDDSGDSDVGDGGGSEDDGSDDNKSSRRSSISSPEEDCEEDKDAAAKPSAIRKHSITESDDRPRAKKPKNNLVVVNPAAADADAATDVRPNKVNKKTGEKLIRPNNALCQNFSEGNLKNIPGRFLLEKGKKSPKKRTGLPKLGKRSVFQQQNNAEETEEERRNAQIRTSGLLKAAKRKSAQALYRNSRRTTHYPGNAWLRHKHPFPWTSDVTSTADCASMTSGAEDQCQMEHDSPFGSVISFATSVSSPIPLRFSQFGKRGRQRPFDSASVSSCMTSPCANDDFSPSIDFLNASPKAREEHNHMPFTEDLRRRLLVVNTTYTPGSSSATSPVLGRAFPNHVGYLQPTSDTNGLHADDLLIATSTGRASSGTGWENTLEEIAEVAPSGKVAVSSEEAKSDTTSPIRPLEQEKMSQKQKVSAHLLARSSSCPDVPFSRISNMADTKFNSPHKYLTRDVVSPVKEKPVEIRPGQNGSEIWNAAKQGSQDKVTTSFHFQDEISPRKWDAAICSGRVANEEIPVRTEFTLPFSEFTPLLQREETDEGESTEIAADLGVEREKLMAKYQRNYDKSPVTNSSPTHESTTFGYKKQRSATLHAGYCSAKEESENAIVADQLVNARNVPICLVNKNKFGASSEKLSQMKETVKQIPLELLDEIHQEDKVPDNVVIPMSFNSDVIIEIT